MQHNKVGEQKSFRLFGHFSLVFLLGTTLLNAGSFEDFKRTQVAKFATYQDERDNSFKKYLSQQFKEYNALKGTPLYEKPKPKTIPLAKPKKIQIVGPKIQIKTEPIEQTTVVQKPFITIPPLIIVKTQPEVKKRQKDINFDFYGSALDFDIPNGIKNAKYYPQTQKGIENFFDSAASSSYHALVDEISGVKESMNLNDWATYLLVLRVSENIFSSQDESKLLSWFIFNKLGYAVKVGLANKHIVLMHYSSKIIYSTPSYIFSNKKFYVLANYNKGSVGRLYSYKQDYPGALKAMDLSMKTLPKLSLDAQMKELSFKEAGKTYKVDFEYNKNLIDLMATYPQADYETFFNTPLDEKTYKAIAQDLKKYIDGKRASEAMNFVLHFVQKSFVYERDDQQFGREKVMFAQETLYFDKSDCEDRAILYAYLVKELFGVLVVGVKYSDHMATALYVPMSGDSVRKGKKSFVVADPTYVNASIGQSMPKYRSIQPESFILVRKN